MSEGNSEGFRYTVALCIARIGVFHRGSGGRLKIKSLVWDYRLRGFELTNGACGAARAKAPGKITENVPSVPRFLSPGFAMKKEH